MQHTTLKNISEFIRTGKTPPTKDTKYFNGDIQWFTPGDLDKSKYLSNSVRTLTNESFVDKKAVRFPAGTLLVACIGDIGKLGITTQECSSNQQITGIKPNNDVDVNYLYYWFRQNREPIQHTANNAVVPILNNKALEQIKIALPPLAEQQKIAAILDAADSLRQKDQQLVERYTTLSQSLFLEMFGDPVANPMGWKKVSISELGTVSTGSTPPSAKNNMFGGKIPFVTPSDLDTENSYKRTVTEEGAVNSRLVQAGALFVCCIGATIGKIRMAKDICTFNQQINAIQWADKINPLYGLHVFGFLRNEVIRRAISTTLPILKKSEFSKIECTVPPIALQNQFAESIKLIEAQKQQAQASLQKSEALFNSLLQQAFTGELTRAPLERAA